MPGAASDDDGDLRLSRAQCDDSARDLPETIGVEIHESGDNTFWIFKQMLGFTTKGTFKIYTLAQSTFAVIGLGVCLLLDLII